MKLKKAIFICFILVLISGVYLVPRVRAFDAAATHKEGLTEKAIELKIKEHSDDPKFLETFGKIVDGKLSLTDNSKLVMQGSEEEVVCPPKTDPVSALVLMVG